MGNSIAKKCKNMAVALIVIGMVLGALVFILGTIRAVNEAYVSSRLDLAYSYYGRSGTSTFDGGVFAQLFFANILSTFFVIFGFCVSALVFKAIAEIINLLEGIKNK